MFLLPVQLDLLDVPSPAVTPTNLLSQCGLRRRALLRYRAQGQRPGELTRWMLVGTIPRVIVGAVIRVRLVPDVRAFRLVAAGVLLPIGVWLTIRAMGLRRVSRRPSLPRRWVTLIGGVVGVAAGLYGIGGGSLLAPILVATGLSVATVGAGGVDRDARDFGGRRVDVRSVGAGFGGGGGAGVGAGTGLRTRRPCGRLCRHAAEQAAAGTSALTLLLGLTATALAIFYVVQALR